MKNIITNKLGGLLCSAACALLSLAATSTSSAAPEPKADESPEIIYTKTVIFEDFHDPGYIVSTAGESYTFGYQGITYENIVTWKKGRKLNLTYSNTEGTRLRDPESGQSAHVATGKHIIDVILEEALEKASCTASTAACYKNAFDMWEADITRNLKRLKKNLSPEDFKIVEQMHSSWLNYKELRFKVGREILGRDSGTIGIIEANTRAVAAIEPHAFFLGSL
jgi:hypothetical protein